MSKNPTSIDNTLVQAGRPELAQGRQVNLPIELGSTVVFDSIEAFEQARDHRFETGTNYYGRYGNTASFELERMLVTLEHAAGVTLTSSGVAAISLTLLALLKPGDHVLGCRSCLRQYPGILRLCPDENERGCRLFRPDDRGRDQ